VKKKKEKLCRCGKKSLTGLVSGVALCQYHYNERQFGTVWADEVVARDLKANFAALAEQGAQMGRELSERMKPMKGR
jgi:hypothetical protein